MLTLDITSFLTEKTARINSRLNTLVATKSGPIQNLFDAGRYSLISEGKRLRPILALATAETLGCTNDSPLDAACALEMIHTYSLIHDDLPCMDDDDFRRGKPSLHKAYSEGLAVLTGDYLLTYAFEVIANDHHLSNSQKVALIQLIAQSSGADGMIGGQVMDIQAEGKTIELESLKQIHSHKTGALFTASILAGAIAANATPAEMQTLRNFGRDIGLAFQIVDDILDITCSEKKHGKKIASDITNNKTTYVSLLSLEGSQAAADKLLAQSLQHLDTLNRDTNILKSLAHKMLQR